MEHELKIWPQYFCRVEDGSKTFELRASDRGFKPGDTVLLREWCPELNKLDEPKGYSGKSLRFRVGYILPVDDKRVVFSLLPIKDSP